MQMEYRGCVINLLDTPGHQDFSEDTYRVLTAVDAALMVIDAANGVEPQTRRCSRSAGAQHADHHLRQQDGPRGARAAGADGRDRARARHRGACPSPGRSAWASLSRRVSTCARAHARFTPGRGPRATTTRSSKGSTIRAYASASAHAVRAARRDRAAARRRAAVRPRGLPGRPQTPVFFGSAHQQLRRAGGAGRAGRPGAAAAAARRRQRMVQPDEPKFTGVVFKIQANMDPAHRDRIAFVRVCSGHFERGMKLKVRALGQGAAAEQRGDLPVASGASCSTRPSPATSSASPTTACCSSATR
jgi:peptide chain release factor 3